MGRSFSPRQLAQAIGVSEASVKRWCDRGLLVASRTGGGHRKIPLASVMHFLRDQGHALVKPEVLGLPKGSGREDGSFDRAVERALAALEASDEDQLRALLLGMRLAGQRLADICDRVLAPVMRAVGERWEGGHLEVYQERLACVMISRCLGELRANLSPLPEDAPTAIGATLEEDPYTLSSLMVEVSLREAGWRAVALGSGHPVATLQAAIHERRPRLFWLSVSCMTDPVRFQQGCAALYEEGQAVGAALAVGGRALDEPLRRDIKASICCETIGRLMSFVEVLPAGRSAS